MGMHVSLTSIICRNLASINYAFMQLLNRHKPSVISHTPSHLPFACSLELAHLTRNFSCIRVPFISLCTYSTPSASNTFIIPTLISEGAHALPVLIRHANLIDWIIEFLTLVISHALILHIDQRLIAQNITILLY